jgi:DNA-directed RNA polymerase subunit alpha
MIPYKEGGVRELIRPKRMDVEKETFSDTHARFIIEPLERGYGVTLGNALRRVLLSSLPGAAAVSVKFDGVSHEFSTISGVKEDVLEIIQNLKSLRVKLHCEKKRVSLEAEGAGEVRASHIQADSDVEIVNPDLHIATLSDEKAHLLMEITLAQGRGYAEAIESRISDDPVGTIPIDAIFMPIKKVSYEVRPARIGRKTSFDSLIVDIHTDGTMKPDEATREAAKILQSYLELFTPEEPIGERVKKEKRTMEFLEQSIDEIGLSGMPLRTLKASGVEKTSDLLNKTTKDLLEMRNFGEKSLKKVQDRLAEYDLKLAQEKEK